MKEVIIKNMDNTINIAMAVNDRFVFPARVTIASIKANKKTEKIKIFIFHFGLNNINNELLEKDSTNGVEIKCIKINESEIANAKMYFDFSKEIMIKLFLHRYLPNDIDKVMWLDSDTIVLGSLFDFYNIDLNDNYFACTVDQKASRTEYLRLDLPKNFDYICVGTMLINIKLLRNDNAYEKNIYNYINSTKCELLFPEQDVVNVLYFSTGKAITLYEPYTFDRFVDITKKKDIINYGICILHYEGYHQKPWKGCACRHYFVWWKYAWTIKEYRCLFFKVLPKYIAGFIKKIFVKIGMLLGIKKKHK